MKKIFFCFFLNLIILPLYSSIGKYNFYKMDNHIGSVSFYNFNNKIYFELNEFTKVMKIKKTIYSVSSKILISFDNKKLVITKNNVNFDGVINLESISRPIIIRGSKYFINSEIFTHSDFAKIFEIRFDVDNKNKKVFIYTDINVASVKYFSYIEKTRVVIYLLKSLKYKTEIFGKKLIVDVDNGVYIKPSESISIGDGKIENIDIVQGKKELKIIIETGELFDGEYETSTLTNPDRIVIDLKVKNDKEIKRIDIPKEDNTIIDDTIQATSTFVLPHKIKQDNKKVIIIDPGHGGKDPGGKVIFGKKEKQINLEIAKKLYYKLKSNDRFETYITRLDDVFIPLYERSKFANDKKCDIFISIHANAHKNKNENGFEIYFLSEKATDPWASEVQNYENASIEYEGGVFDYTGAALVLHSLARNEYINEGSKLAAYIAKYMQKQTPFANRGIKQAAFYVLRGTYCAGVLLEVGFMTNKKDKQNLDNQNIQNKVADAIYRGIIEYDKNSR